MILYGEAGAAVHQPLLCKITCLCVRKSVFLSVEEKYN